MINDSRAPWAMSQSGIICKATIKTVFSPEPHSNIDVDYDIIFYIEIKSEKKIENQK